MRRVVCAAVFLPEIDLIIPGVRHYDTLMHNLSESIPEVNDNPQKEIQGFVDNQGKFMDRQEAWKVACSAGQVINRVGGDDRKGGTLYSENLY